MREVGITAYNHSESENFSWAHGAYFDRISETRKERIDMNQGIRIDGRAVWLPYYDEPFGDRSLDFAPRAFSVCQARKSVTNAQPPTPK